MYASRHMLQSNVTCCALHALKRVVYSVSRDQVNDVSYVVAEISSFDALFFYILDAPRPKSVFRCHCLPSAYPRLSLGDPTGDIR